MTDLTRYEAPAQELQTRSQSIFDLGPAQMVKSASSMATVLADVIEKQRLYTLIQGKKHVRVDGWATLGSMLGILPKERSVTEHADGSFEAFVDLVSVRDGRVVGGGSALCSIEEKRWSNAERYARRSMAITRATGKAYRLGFAWVMALAGYDATPAEEMDGVYRSNDEPGPSSDNARSSKSGSSGSQRRSGGEGVPAGKGADAPPAKPKEVFSVKTDGHLERLGKVVGDRLTDSKQQARLIELMEGKEMTKANVDKLIDTVRFEQVVEAEIL